MIAQDHVSRNDHLDLPDSIGQLQLSIVVLEVRWFA